MNGTHRPPIPPVTDAVRPLWSVMVPTYNCARYLRFTLESILAQDPGPDVMQIEVVDDWSTDDPEAVVRAMADERVGFHRQASNVGHVANFNTCLRRARGRFVHLLHGDDAVRPGFYARLGDAMEAEPTVGAAFSRHRIIDEQGREGSAGIELQSRAGLLPDAPVRIAAEQPFQTPCAVVRRAVYEKLGGFDPRFRFCGEDWEMWVRIAAHFPVWYEPNILALYRRHTMSRSSLTGRSLSTGENLKDLRRSISIYQSYLPAEHAAVAARGARRRTALWGVGLARNLFAIDRDRAALSQLREAVRSSASPSILLAVARLTARAVIARGLRLSRLRRPSADAKVTGSDGPGERA